MGSLSIVHWIIVLFLAFVVGFPVARILSRMGYSKIWAILVMVPVINWIAIWVLAYAKWPAVHDNVETFE